MLPRPLHLVNELLAFLLELVAFALLAALGWHLGGNAVVGSVLVVLFVGVGVVLWGLFAAPKARFPVGLPAVMAVKTAVFGAAAVAGAVTVGAGFGAVCAVVFLVNTVLATADRESEIRRSRDAAGSGAAES